MEKLRNKSEFNLSAARLLIDKSLFAPSVHCSYYCCLQLVKVVIFTVLGQDQREFEATMARQGGKSHRYMWDSIKTAIAERRNRQEEREASRKFKDLKTYREESDYLDIEVDHSKGEKAYAIALELKNIIQKTFYS